LRFNIIANTYSNFTSTSHQGFLLVGEPKDL
jgi:hypothetical protein